MDKISPEQVYELALVYKSIHLLAGSSDSGKEVLSLFKSVPSQYLLLIYKTKMHSSRVRLSTLFLTTTV